MSTQPATVQNMPTPCSDGYFINRAHKLAALDVPLRELQKNLVNENKACSQPLDVERIYTYAKAAARAQKAKLRNEKIKAAQQEKQSAAPPEAARLAAKPAIVPMPSQEERLAQWVEVETFLKQNYLNPDIMGAKAIYACVASHRVSQHAPAWLLPIAPPGSMKTELLKSCDGLPGVHLIDEVTENTFISGQLDSPGRKRQVPASLLHRIGNDGIIIVPDFSTVLEMNKDKRGTIFSQMRRIYDGQLRREFGTAENLDERE